ncbi:MAG: RdgB/HAM1 family non-canonical purine NTP pyrophosphatase [Planctomycetota bacterium]|nr:RdgB/HAM1 family non-canonical purine NTP pyrophosphatase [Planctomycetota bacterium]
MNRLVVATTNKGKLAELTPMLRLLGYEVCGLADFPDIPVAVEDGKTFAENAQKKADHYARATGMDALADDSGLCVGALDDAPGVHSARFAGDGANDTQNNEALLLQLQGTENRSAHFACVLCLVRQDKPVALMEGRCEGHIAETPRGTNGFGYDPLFIPNHPSAQGRTFAEAPSDLKRELSHRAAALAALRTMLEHEAVGASPGSGAGASS